jgi:hypothetical protein
MFPLRAYPEDPQLVVLKDQLPAGFFVMEAKHYNPSSHIP